MAKRRVASGHIRALSINLILIAMTLYVAVTLFWRLLVFDETGQINFVASVPAIGTVILIPLFGIVGILLSHGWLLLLFTIIGWLTTSFYEPLPLFAGINYILIIAVLAFSNTVRFMVHISADIRKGAVETISKHYNKVFFEILKRITIIMGLAIALIGLGSIIMQQTVLEPGIASVLAGFLLMAIGLTFVLARRAMGK